MEGKQDNDRVANITKKGPRGLLPPSNTPALDQRLGDNQVTPQTGGRIEDLCLSFQVLPTEEFPWARRMEELLRRSSDVVCQPRGSPTTFWVPRRA